MIPNKHAISCISRWFTLSNDVGFECFVGNKDGHYWYEFFDVLQRSRVNRTQRAGSFREPKPLSNVG